MDRFSIKELRRYIEKHEIIAALTIIFIGALLRLLFIGSFPPGLNQDEASAGYEAWSLLHYGMDRNGCTWPVLFTAWGSGQNVLYSYISIPFIAVFGLSIITLRLAMGLTGSIALVIFWLTARRIRGKTFGLLALLGIALNPWHILSCRWALESNLLPFMLLLGISFLTLADKQPHMLIVAAAVLSLSLYSYGTAFIFLPFFLVLTSIILLKRKTVKLSVFIEALFLFIIIALPITMCNIRNVLGYDSIRIFGLTLPKLTETRQNSVTVFGGGGVTTAANNFLGFIRILMKQSDGLPWNSAGAFGLLYGPAGMLLSLLGLINYIMKIIKRNAEKNETYIFIALLSSFAASFFIDANINRMNMALIPLIWYQAEGVYTLFKIRKWFMPAAAAAFMIAGAFFTRYYFTDYASGIAPFFYDGLGDAIIYADTLDTEKIWVTYDVNMPYIYVLFYTEYPTDKFISSVKYLNPEGAFRWVSSFGIYRFGSSPPEDTLCIVEASKTKDMKVLGTFGNYAVVKS